jgi:hypothetical protein
VRLVPLCLSLALFLFGGGGRTLTAPHTHPPQQNNKTESTYTKPAPFHFNEPDAGPVTVASTSSFNSVHLVTRAAAPEQKSLIYVNGTEVSGHLRSAVSIPSPPPLPAAAGAFFGLYYLIKVGICEV